MVPRLGDVDCVRFGKGEAQKATEKAKTMG